jgi:metal-responsive CopG/Arc/MetJ family transcriptional regulator
MHRTQIYFEEELLAELKQAAQQTNMSMSAYIRKVLKKDLIEKKEKQKNVDFSDFKGIWQDRDITPQSLREQAWKP